MASNLDINARERNEAWAVYLEWSTDQAATSAPGPSFSAELEDAQDEIARLE